MMGIMAGGNSKKGLASVLLNKLGEATDSPKEDPQAINPDQGLIDACAEFAKATEKKDAARMARCFKAMIALCEREEEDDGESYED